MGSILLKKMNGYVEKTDLNFEEITEWDESIFKNLISLDLRDDQVEQVLTPPIVYSNHQDVLAVHWHPEHVPMELIKKRIGIMFPVRKSELIIPTQHNVLMENDGYCGVEVDCYSRGFGAKVQLLLHFEKSKVENAEILKSMLSHTFKYRSSQLFDFIETIVNPERQEALQEAAGETGANDEVVEFTKNVSKKLKGMLEKYESITPAESVKNKLLSNYVDTMRGAIGDRFANRVQLFLKAVKIIVKRNFPLYYFYRVNEIIEEVRGLGGGVVIPHPEQFWPILLAGYDVDGYEVWNPQSRRYTEFLINVVNNQNKTIKATSKPVLIFMGDDTHMGEKTKDPKFQNREKAGREIGFQPAWEELMTSKSLIAGNISKASLITEYRARLS